MKIPGLPIYDMRDAGDQQINPLLFLPLLYIQTILPLCPFSVEVGPINPARGFGERS